MTETVIRPMLPADVDAADELKHRALRGAVLTYSNPGADLPLERTPEQRDTSRVRVAHLQRTDPDGCFVAEADGVIVGMTQALRRGPLWFLSLLTVEVAIQSRGLGARLLTAALATAEGAGAAWISSSEDPRAMRRYARSGFALRPALHAHGALDRALLPGGLAVHVSDLPTHADLVEDVVTGLRGVGYGPDLEAFVGAGCVLTVVDDVEGRGYAFSRGADVHSLGATTPHVARRLLLDSWARVTEAGAKVGASWLTAEQGWAMDAALEVGLPLTHGGPLCVRSSLGPLTPYLPSGAYG